MIVTVKFTFTILPFKLIGSDLELRFCSSFLLNLSSKMLCHCGWVIYLGDISVSQSFAFGEHPLIWCKKCHTFWRKQPSLTWILWFFFGGGEGERLSNVRRALVIPLVVFGNHWPASTYTAQNKPEKSNFHRKYYLSTNSHHATFILLNLLSSAKGAFFK